jgi:glutaredoxin
VSDPRVVLYTRAACHLCDDARLVIEQVCREVGEAFEEVDISASTELERRFGEEVPVTFVDGEQHDFFRVSADRLRRALVSPRRS